MRKNLLLLGKQTIDFQAKNKEDSDNKGEIESKYIDIHTQLIKEGTRDKIILRQLRTVPKLQVSDHIQYSFKYYYDKTKEPDFIEWCTGTVTKVSNSSNLRNTNTRPKFN